MHFEMAARRFACVGQASLRAPDLWIELRSFSALEHSVVADDAHAPVTQFSRHSVWRPESTGRVSVLPGQEQQKLARHGNAFECLCATRPSA